MTRIHAKTAIRDVGRVLGVPLNQVDSLAKQIPDVPGGVSLQEALQQSPDFKKSYEAFPWAKNIIDNALKVEGLCRGFGTHAAGVIISPAEVTDIGPVRMDDRTKIVVTEFDKKGIEKIGWVKMDFLGLSNLGAITETLKNIEITQGKTLRIEDIPLDDSAVFALLANRDTYGVFQGESETAARILADMKPTNLGDLAAAVALNRPGCLNSGADKSYILRKNNKEKIHAIIPQLEEILKDTFAVLVYQDQVMEVAVKLSGFTMGEADKLRAAMGKKDQAKMASMKPKFIKGAMASGVSEKNAYEVFELIEKFAEYGFNKAHSYCYGLIAYQTAYLKAHYPVEYTTALLNMKAADSMDKIRDGIYDAKKHNIEILPPNVNKSNLGFTITREEPGRIYYGLGTPKGVRESDIKLIIEEREKNGPYLNLLDFIVRFPGKINKKTLENLSYVGAFNDFGDQGAIIASIKDVKNTVDSLKKKQSKSNLVDDINGEKTVYSRDEIELFKLPEEFELVSRQQQLEWERQFLGTYVSGHPLDDYKDLIYVHSDSYIRDLRAENDGENIQIAGIIQDFRKHIPKKYTNDPEKESKEMAFFVLDDTTSQIEVTMFARTFAEFKHLLDEDKIIVLEGRVQKDMRSEANFQLSEDGESLEDKALVKIIGNHVYELDGGKAPRKRQIADFEQNKILHIRYSRGEKETWNALKKIIQMNPGNSKVVVHLEDQGEDVSTVLNDKYSVHLSPKLFSELRAVLADNPKHGYKISDNSRENPFETQSIKPLDLP